VSASATPSGTVTPAGTVASPSASPSGAAGAAAVEAAARAYFDAIGEPRLADLESHSVGELRLLARWWRILSNEFQGHGVLIPAGAAISSLKVTSVAGHTATVQIRGWLEEITSSLTTGGGGLIRSVRPDSGSKINNLTSARSSTGPRSTIRNSAIAGGFCDATV